VHDPTSEVRSCFALALLVLLATLGASAIVGRRVWRARHPHVLEDASGFVPGEIAAGGGGVVVARRSTGAGLGLEQRAVSPDVRLYSLDTGAATGTLSDPDGLLVRGIAVSPTGELVATVASASSGELEVRLWRSATHDLVWTASFAPSVTSSTKGVDAVNEAEFTPDRERLLVVSPGEVGVFSVADGALRHRIPLGAEELHCWLAGRFFLQSFDQGSGLVVRSAADGSHVNDLALPPNCWIRASPRGGHYGLVLRDNTLQVCTLPSGTEVVSFPLGVESEYGDDFALSADDEFVAHAAAMGKVREIQCWRIADGHRVMLVREVPAESCTTLTFAPDRDAVLASWGGKIHVFPFRR